MLERPAEVNIDDEFWNEWLERIREITLPRQHEWLEETGRIDNFRKAAAGEGEFEGRPYNDSDLYKWLESACYILQTESDPDLQVDVEDAVGVIRAAQWDDGYLNTYFTLEAPDDRWQNLSVMHELYCAGHLFEAAVAHYRAIGSDRLLAVACRLADHIDDVFGESGRDGVPGHEEIELALVKLYRVTDDKRYLDLARLFIDRRGQDDSRLQWEANNLDAIPGAEYNPGVNVNEKYREHVLNEEGEYSGEYHQNHRPVREQDRPVGHAVRATYLYAAMTDLAADLNDDELQESVEQLWENTTTKRMYITGGLGSSYRNEGFTEDYDLPNETAYTETCAAVGNVFWNDRMTRLTKKSQYADLMERTLYNAVLPGISVNGKGFRYVNPLSRTTGPYPLNELDDKYDSDRFSYDHQEWFTCACCPSNAARLLMSLNKYIYASDDEAIYINLYIGSQANTTVNDTEVTVRQDTAYPWGDSVTFELTVDEPITFDFALRVPEWTENTTIRINGTAQTAPVIDGYAKVARRWANGDVIEVEFDLPVRQVEAHPKVCQTAERVAIQRGPIVFCLEERDNTYSPHEIQVDRRSSFETQYRRDLFDGIMTIIGHGRAPAEATLDSPLYRPREGEEWNWEEVEIMAIPYFAWGQRDDGEMAVWVRKG